MKCFVAITCLLALSVPSRAHGYDGLVYAPGYASPEHYSYPSYAYEYSVRDPHTGDNKAVWEKRDGDLVIGGYSFVEPGGSVRIVEYRADKSGFTAPVVRHIGPKVHPGGATSTTNIYKPSTPIQEVARIVPAAPIVAPPAPVHVPLPAPLPAPLPVPIHPAPYFPRPRIPIPVPLPVPVHPAPFIFSAPRIPIPLPLPLPHGIGHAPYNYNYDLYNPLRYH